MEIYIDKKDAKRAIDILEKLSVEATVSDGESLNRKWKPGKNLLIETENKEDSLEIISMLEENYILYDAYI